MPAAKEAARRRTLVLVLISLLTAALWLVLLVVSAFNGLVVGLGLLIMLALNPTRASGWPRR
jgi:hypothetical protein